MKFFKFSLHLKLAWRKKLIQYGSESWWKLQSITVRVQMMLRKWMLKIYSPAQLTRVYLGNRFAYTINIFWPLTPWFQDICTQAHNFDWRTIDHTLPKIGSFRVLTYSVNNLDSIIKFCFSNGVFFSPKLLCKNLGITLEASWNLVFRAHSEIREWKGEIHHLCRRI